MFTMSWKAPIHDLSGSKSPKHSSLTVKHLSKNKEFFSRISLYSLENLLIKAPLQRFPFLHLTLLVKVGKHNLPCQALSHMNVFFQISSFLMWPIHMSSESSHTAISFRISLRHVTYSYKAQKAHTQLLAVWSNFTQLYVALYKTWAHTITQLFHVNLHSHSI